VKTIAYVLGGYFILVGVGEIGYTSISNSAIFSSLAQLPSIGPHVGSVQTGSGVGMVDIAIGGLLIAAGYWFA
jgi:hypothetical protein